MGGLLTILVGTKEAGIILGWDRRKVSTYHLRGAFPTPICNLFSGPVWSKDQIEFFKQTKGMRMPIYYLDDSTIYQCMFKKTLQETNLTLEHLNGSKEPYILWESSSINKIRNLIGEESPLIKYLSHGSISNFYDYGLLSVDDYKVYLKNIKHENI